MKNFVKWLLRRVLYARLSLLSLSEPSALYWVDVMKRWPAIFGAEPFRHEIVLSDGSVMAVGLIDVVERNLYLHGCWDKQILDAIRNEVVAGSVFVDIGANIGYFTLQASRLVGENGMVVAIEPSHVNLARLSDHLCRNKSSNVLVASLAAGGDFGLPTINFPTYNNAGAASLRPLSSIQGNRVLQWPLDAVFEAHAIRPDVIKIDIEGFELEALKGMRNTLAAFGPLVICELTDSFLQEIGQSSRELIAFMESFGYTCKLMTNADSFRVGQLLLSTDSELPRDQVDVLFRRLKVRGNDSIGRSLQDCGEEPMPRTGLDEMFTDPGQDGFGIGIVHVR